MNIRKPTGVVMKGLEVCTRSYHKIRVPFRTLPPLIVFLVSPFRRQLERELPCSVLATVAAVARAAAVNIEAPRCCSALRMANHLQHAKRAMRKVAGSNSVVGCAYRSAISTAGVHDWNSAPPDMWSCGRGEVSSAASASGPSCNSARVGNLPSVP